jgi:ABC-type transporter Mla maintaining outer membrane lipid asymmetry permease subunit MlaE
MKKATWVKLLVMFLAAVIFGLIGGVLFSLHFYGFIPDFMLAKVYLSDTPSKMHFRFWIAFIVGAIIGIIWSYKAVKDLK